MFCGLNKKNDKKVLLKLFTLPHGCIIRVSLSKTCFFKCQNQLNPEKVTGFRGNNDRFWAHLSISYISFREVELKEEGDLHIRMQNKLSPSEWVGFMVTFIAHFTSS